MIDNQLYLQYCDQLSLIHGILEGHQQEWREKKTTLESQWTGPTGERPAGPHHLDGAIDKQHFQTLVYELGRAEEVLEMHGMSECLNVDLTPPSAEPTGVSISDVQSQMDELVNLIAALTEWEGSELHLPTIDGQ